MMFVLIRKVLGIKTKKINQNIAPMKKLQNKKQDFK